MGVDGGEPIIADATIQPLIDQRMHAIPLSKPESETDGTLSRQPAVTSVDIRGAAMESPATANTMDDATMAREDAIRRAERLGLTEIAIRVKADLEVALKELSTEGEDTAFIMLSSRIAEAAGSCLNLNDAMWKSNQLLLDQAKYDDRIATKVGDIAEKVYSVFSRFFRN